MVLRGLESRHEQDPSQLLRDTRTMGQRIADFFKNPTGVAVLLIIMGASGVYVPELADMIGVLGIIFFVIGATRKASLPFRMPQRSGMLDYNDRLPSNNKPRKARGIYFFGNEAKTNHELWFSNDDMRTHVLIFGSTGSGKTEGLVSIAYNALVQSSGFIYVDGKGDNTLYAKIFSMVRYMGREDDLLLINFMTGARDIVGPQEARLSNTLNPFSTGSSSMLSQLIVSMMDSGSSSGDSDMWKGRAIAFVEALMKVLVAMRDAGHILLDANTIRNYFVLDRVQSMVEDKRFVRDGQEAISTEFLPDVVMEPIRNYLINLPGYAKERGRKQVSQVLEQHGFITMQLTRVFSSLADTYGHILRTKLAEVDLKDVVLNRRILIVLLPALEKSPDELANLGKIIIASMRAMMAAGLGDEVEGDFRDLVLRKPTNAPTPFLCILDEYGYYAVKGFAVVPAQARSLGFSVVFAGQDLPAFQKASKEEALSIGANTNIKICMKLEDPQDTWEFFMKTAGESYVAHVSGFQSNAGSVSNSYLDTRGASVEKRQRVDLLDLKEQREGEMHIFFKSKIVRGRFFYADPQPVRRLRLNQFLKVDIPKDMELYTLVKGIEDFDKIIKSGDLSVVVPEVSQTIETLVGLFADVSQKTPVERGIAVLLAFHDRSTVIRQELVQEEVQISEDQLSVFARVALPQGLENKLPEEDVEQYGMPLVGRARVSQQLSYLERLCGANEGYAIDVAAEIVKDMQIATEYPPSSREVPDPAVLADKVVALIGQIDLMREAAEGSGDDGENKGGKGGKKGR